MKQIVCIHDFQCDCLDVLRSYICEETMILQGKGYEVDIQYGAVDKSTYTALVIAYQHNK